MKKIKILLLLTCCLSLGFFSCDDNRQAIEESEEVGALNNKAMVSINSNVTSGDINEGTVVEYTINFDKPVSANVNFVAVLKGGTAGENDVDLGSAQLARYGTSTTLSITIENDLIPENDETAIITIEAASPSSDYFVHPNSNIPDFNYNIKSPVDPNDLIVALEWDIDAASDLDMFSVSAVNGPWDQQWTGDYPEVKNLVWGVDPDGTYYLGIDPYSVENDVTEFWYKWSLGQPDGTVTVIEGVFDYENRNTVYTIDSATGGTASYRLVTVTKTGTTFVAAGN